MSDSITDEIRATRRKLAAQFGNDLSLILADIRQREASDGRHYVTLPPRLTKPEAGEDIDAPKPPIVGVINNPSAPATQ
jgi:hypothetical protein